MRLRPRADVTPALAVRSARFCQIKSKRRAGRAQRVAAAVLNAILSLTGTSWRGPATLEAVQVIWVKRRACSQRERPAQAGADPQISAGATPPLCRRSCVSASEQTRSERWGRRAAIGPEVRTHLDPISRPSTRVGRFNFLFLLQRNFMTPPTPHICSDTRQKAY